ncbi:hypothetical protein DENSPDRAFT_14163 [Dentipellis sp. KUC8613]|nr:hypothetical protein DENSPDRAFT_14163 [Dentipellis sp. KUC8613]
MAPLPSFVELMASLGIEEGTPVSAGQSRTHSRGSSVSSAASSSSRGDENDYQQPQSGNYLLVPARYSEGWKYNGDSDVESPCLSRHGKGRYSPYSSVAKRKSAPSLHPSLQNGTPDRATSASPLRSPRFSQSPRLERMSRRRGHTWTGEPELPAITPISTFVRRKSPHSPSGSPTTSTFPASVVEPPTIIPLAPVAIPALPTLLPSFCRPAVVEHTAVPASSCT